MLWACCIEFYRAANDELRLLLHRKRIIFANSNVHFLPEAIDAVFARDQKRFDFYRLGATTTAPLTMQSQRFISKGRVPTLEMMPHTAFKWRSISSSMLNRSMQRLFERHQVLPIVILRRKLWPQCTKIVLSELFDGSPHMQFSAGKMNSDLYQEYRQKQQKYSVYGDEDLFLKIENCMERFQLKSEKILEYVTSVFARCPDKILLFAEDIFRDDVDKVNFENVMSGIFGEKIDIGEAGGIPTRKAGITIDALKNIEQLHVREKIQYFERRYQNALCSFGALARILPSR